MPLAGWRVGVPVEYDVAECSNEVRAAWSETCTLLERLGASVTPVTLPSTAAALAAYYVLAPRRRPVTWRVRRGPVRPERGGETVGTVPRETANLGRRWQTTRVKPGTRVFVPRGARGFHESTASARSRGFGPEVQRRVLVGTYVLGTDVTARYFDRAQRVRRVVSGVRSASLRRRGGGAGGAGGGSDAFGLSGRARGIAHTGVDLLLTPDRADGGASAVRTGRGGRGRSIRFDQSGTGRFAHSAHTTGWVRGGCHDGAREPRGAPRHLAARRVGVRERHARRDAAHRAEGATSSSSARLGTSAGARADAAANGGGVGPRPPGRRQGSRAAADWMGARSQGARDGGCRSVQRDGRFRVGAAVGRARGGGKVRGSFEGTKVIFF